MGMGKPRLKRVLQAGLGIGLLAALISVVDVGETVALLRRARPGWLIAGLLVTVASRCLMAYKWNLLLRAKGIWLRHLEALRIYYIGNFLGLFLPATVGLDVLRTLYVKPHAPGRVPEVISSILVERLLGVLMIGLAAVGGCLALAQVTVSQSGAVRELLVASAALLGVAVLVIGVSFTGRFGLVVARLLDVGARRGGWAARVAGKLREVFDSYQAYRHHRSALVAFLLLTAVEIGTVVLWNYCVGLSLGLDLPFHIYLYVIPPMALLVRLPITISGVGLREGAFVVLLAVVGVPREESLALGVLAHALDLVALLTGGLWYALSPQYRRPSAARLEEVTAEAHPAGGRAAATGRDAPV